MKAKTKVSAPSNPYLAHFKGGGEPELFEFTKNFQIMWLDRKYEKALSLLWDAAQSSMITPHLAAEIFLSTHSSFKDLLHNTKNEVLRAFFARAIFDNISEPYLFNNAINFMSTAVTNISKEDKAFRDMCVLYFCDALKAHTHTPENVVRVFELIVDKSQNYDKDYIKNKSEEKVETIESAGKYEDPNAFLLDALQF